MDPCPRDQFLAPTGAQEMLVSVRPVQVCLELSIFIVLTQILEKLSLSSLLAFFSSFSSLLAFFSSLNYLLALSLSSLYFLSTLFQLFLAPTGAQEVLIFVSLFQTCLEQSNSKQSIKIRVIQSEPKILRLV